MWNFLRRGQSGTRAVEILEELALALDNLVGGMPSDQTIAANSYLIWAEKAERELVSIYQSPEIPRALQSERYWRISAMDASTMRPFPMIRAEVEFQALLLGNLLTQLKHYTSLLARDQSHWLVVPDTNVYIHERLFHEIEWHREVGSSEATIVMPLVVLDELDKVKDRDPNFGRRAQSVLLAIDRITLEKDWLTPIRLRPKVWLQLMDEPFGHRRRPGHDDEIVRQAEYFGQLNGDRLVLLTRDRGMRLRAQAAGLLSKSLPQRLERIQKPSDA